ncbi:MAG TPA: fibronectin type III domain-containing protein [Lacisediminihabitans sp.]|nr:fibronectin type III domain-containing protein [Lacisediminihabitans sp.]HXD61659.1 fibronectin type III domain-containing protein [Lacisediminihabitans sp.]
MNARSRVRHRATRSAASRTSALVALGLAGILGIGLGLPATGSYALWNSATAVSAGSIQAGSLTAAASVSPTLAVTYSSSTTSKTGGFTVTNNGTAAATYATAATLRSGSDATLARNVTVVVWKTASVATCGSPASAVTGTWSAFPALSGTLAAGAAQSYCVRTTIGAVTGLSSGATVYPTLTATLKIGGWSSAAAVAITQSFTDDAKPSTPTGLVASSTTTSSTRLSWNASTDNVGVKDYLVYRGSTLVATLAAPTTAFTDSGLTAGTSYSYTVKARDAAGNVSAASAALVVKTIPALVCTGSSGWSVTYGWPQPSGDQSTLRYELLVNNTIVGNIADGWNPYVIIPGNDMAYLNTLSAGSVTVEVRQILPNNGRAVMGMGTLVLGQPNYRTYNCG